MDFPIIAVLAATLTIATPLVFGGLGALLGERTGVLNLGIEGTLYAGAFVGFLVGRAEPACERESLLCRHAPSQQQRSDERDEHNQSSHDAYSLHTVSARRMPAAACYHRQPFS